ncbi:MAG: hydroxyisourate hydrolase [Chloroflexi bacterium]|nr:MAG: hydroxyisourate hydrolase [Chloroflexota bacterium]TMD54432.1 MAG: hydroxyisourate hydrolase [Chloroflexota bacterium]
MTSAGISTHVLDTTRGGPAAGVAVTVYRREGRELAEVGRGTTGEDGRISSLLSAELTPGWYQLVFDLSTYYGSQQHFFTRVTLDVAVSETRHHHVPLLVSPFSCTSYRGS